MRTRFQQALDELRQRLLLMGGLAEQAVDRACLAYGIRAGLIFCLDRAFPYELNEIIVEKAIVWRDRGVVGIDIAGPESATFRVADYRRLFRRARQYGLGLTVHTGEAGPVEEVARDSERDNFLTAEQAQAYGLIDQILHKRSIGA